MSPMRAVPGRSRRPDRLFLSIRNRAPCLALTAYSAVATELGMRGAHRARGAERPPGGKQKPFLPHSCSAANGVLLLDVRKHDGGSAVASEMVPGASWEKRSPFLLELAQESPAPPSATPADTVTLYRRQRSCSDFLPRAAGESSGLWEPPSPPRTNAHSFDVNSGDPGKHTRPSTTKFSASGRSTSELCISVAQVTVSTSLRFRGVVPYVVAQRPTPAARPHRTARS